MMRHATDHRPSLRPGHGLLHRGCALVLSWVFAANTVWAAAPPPLSAAQTVRIPPLPRRTMDRSLSNAVAKALSTLSAEAPETTTAPAPTEASATMPEPQAGGGGGASASVTIFGPQKYVRTTGPKNEYTSHVTVPPWVASPFRMTIQNGEANGTCRVSSAWVEVNGTLVAGPSDFNQNVASLERTVTLTPSTTLHITLASKPCSFLIINLAGGNADRAPPQVAVTDPVPGSTTNDSTPRFRVTFRDVAGPGDPAASGVDVATLRVYLDGVERTALFTRRCGEATAELPDSLALLPGPHQLRATIKDFAGNSGEATSDFRVDLAPPTVQVTTVPPGAYLPTRTPQIRVAYHDDVAVDLGTFKVTINGTDRTALFQKGPNEAVATLTDATALPEGPNSISATIKDTAGNPGSGGLSFSVDVRAPRLTISQPPNGSRHGANRVEVIVDYGDDQALDLGSFAATLDQASVTLSQGSDGASGTLGPLADGGHHLAVSIKDRAGNPSAATSDFTVDTGIPEIHVLQPPSGIFLNTATPQVLITYADPQGVNTTTLKVTFRTPSTSFDATSLFTIGPSSATATVPAAQRLPEGPNTISAEIKDLTGSPGTDSSTFVVDTIAPEGTLVSPPSGAKMPEARPIIRFSYSDGTGTGVDRASVHVLIDGHDRTELFTISESVAEGRPDAPLGEGDHLVQLTMKDRAGNPGGASGSFTVDTLPPTAAVIAPADNSFINDSTPDLRVRYGDGTGSGVAAGSVHVFLHRGDEPEADITGYFQVGDTEATGVVPAASALTDGTYHLRVVLADRAGNPGETVSSFELDTVPPTYEIESPAKDDVLPTATPSVLVRYRDDPGHQVDPSRFVFKIDGVDLTHRLTVQADQAAGTLTAAEALAEGGHQVEVRVVDQAGNVAPPREHAFVVDTIAPVASVQAPAEGAYLSTNRPLVRFEYHDVGPAASGIDTTTVRIQVDTADRTAEFTVGSATAEATLASPLADGQHSVHIDVYDRADSHGQAGTTFFVDTLAPVLAVTSPAEGAVVGPEGGQRRVTLTGNVEDLDPQITVQCLAGGVTVAATVTAGHFTCTVPVEEGDNAIQVTASDRALHTTSLTRSVVMDSVPPQVTIVEPAPHTFTGASTIDVSGTVIDAHPGTVNVQGVEVAVSGTSFTATGVPIGDGPDVTIQAVATDLAGNVGPPATVTIHVDRHPPAVHITQPTTGQYLRGPLVEVKGTVNDNGPVTVDVNGQPVLPPGMNPFAVSVPAADGPLTLVATARDAAGNTATDQVTVTIDSAPPVITVAEPPEGTITRAQSVPLSGTVTDASPTTLKLDGTPLPLSGGSFSGQLNLPAEGVNTFLLLATDAAGNSRQHEVSVDVDRTPPVLQVVSPLEGAVVGALPVLVQGLVQDAHAVTVTVDGVPANVVQGAWQMTFPVLPEGPHTFVVVATDVAGNQTTVTRDVVIDLFPPVVAIVAPAAGLLTRAATVEVSGTVQERSAVSVAVNGVAAAVTGTGPFAFTATVPLVEGDNRLTAVATDQTGRTGEASVTVTRDSVPPLVDLLAPATIAKSRGGEAVATASDNVGLAQVVIRVGDVVVATFIAPPFRVDLTVPAGASPGDTLVVSAEATDRAGNSAVASRGVRVTSDGVVVGQVLSDRSGLPLPGAMVRVAAGSGSGVEATTDEHGRYSLPARDPELMLVASKDGLTSVDREVEVGSGVGTVPLDARLTPLAELQSVGPDGATLSVAGPPPLSVNVPAGALAQTTGLRLTGLSPQGLPGLLPLGYSPLAAFDLRGETPSLALSRPMEATFSGLPGGPLHLVAYRATTHGWYMVTPGLGATDGVLTVSLPAPGAYAVVVTDTVDPPMAVPPADEILTGLPMVPVPSTAASTGIVDPPALPPTGGTARGTLTVQAPAGVLPSGTVVQAEVTETFTLASGDVASEEKRLEDILLFRAPVPASAGTSPPAEGTSRLFATFPIQASRTFETTALTQGKVHLDILAGRESARGKTGGNEAVSLEAGDVRLSVPAHALADDTALAVESVALSSFLPSAGGLVPLSEAVLDFSGQSLDLSAELSFATAAVGPTDSLLIARVERLAGIPRLVVVAAASLVGDRAVSRPIPGLPGVTREGRYVLYRTPPVGYVAGTAASSGGPVKAVLQAEGLPFIALSGADGRYVLAAPTGRVRVSAAVPQTSLQGSGEADVTADERATLDVLLAGTVSTAQVSPPDGLSGVETNIQVEIITAVPLNPATVIAANVRLIDLNANTTVATRLVLSGSGKLLAVVPEARLLFSTAYRLEASGLADVFGGLVSVPSITFTTKADLPPVYNTNALVFSFPDQDGNVTMTAPAGSFPPGTQILIINSGNGVVASFTAENDGAVGKLLPATFQAALSDRLFVTITDPLGNVTSFERSQFLDPATGRTAVGPGGGTVTGPGNVEVRIPEGAIEGSVTLKIQGVTADELQAQFPDQKPEFASAHVGSGLKVDAPDKPTFNKEVKLAFPLPDGLPSDPKKAFFYVYRRVQAPDNGTLFETIDHAFIECPSGKATCTPEEQRVVTASFPFVGYANSFGVLDAAGAIGSVASSIFFLMWTFDSLLPAKPLPGVVTGRVLRPVFKPGVAEPTYEGVPGLPVSAVDADGHVLFVLGSNGSIATTQPDGRFVFWDPQFTSGTVEVATNVSGRIYKATAFAQQNVNSDTDPALFRLFAGGYANVASANILVPPAQAIPPPAPVEVRLFKEVDNQRQPAPVFVLAGTPLVVGFRQTPTKGTPAEELRILAATINDQELGVKPDPQKETLPKDPTSNDFILSDTYIPARAGTYTVKTTALRPIGAPIPVVFTFRAIADGGTGTENLPNEAPKVITARVLPKNGALGVPVTTFPEVAFSEPVRNLVLNEVSRNVKLIGPSGEVPLRLTGVGKDGSGNPVPISITSATDTVTSVTLEPLTGLAFGSVYRIVLTNGIEDLDKDLNGSPAPKKLEPFESTFTTFGPEAVGGSVEQPALVGMVVLQDRAYVAETNYPGGSAPPGQNGYLRVYDVSDPVVPEEIPPATFVQFHPSDIAGTGDENQRLVALSLRPRLRYELGGSPGSYFFELKSTPANLFLYDVTTDSPKWIGAVSMTSDILDGTPDRIVIKGSRVYSATWRKGIQIVGLDEMQSGFVSTGPEAIDISRQLSGAGYNLGTAVTIPVKDLETNFGTNLKDLKVGDYVVTGSPTILVIAAGPRASTALVVADAVQGSVLWQGSPSGPAGTLSSGSAVALADIAGRPIALVGGVGIMAGSGGASFVLAVVDLTDLLNPPAPPAKREPKVLSMFKLANGVGDIVFKDQIAIVSGVNGGSPTGLATLVNLSDPANPLFAGSLTGVGSRMALSDNNILFSTERSYLKGTPRPLDGVRTATLGPVAAIPPVRPTLSKRVAEAGAPPGSAGKEETLSDIKVEARVFPSTYPADSTTLQLLRNGVAKDPPVALPMENGKGVLTLPKGFLKTAGEVLSAVFTFKTEGREVVSQPRNIAIGSITLTVDSNNDTVVDDKDDQAISDDPNRDDPTKAIRFTFWDAEKRNSPIAGDTAGLVDYATVRLRLKIKPAPDERIGILMPSGDWQLRRKLLQQDLRITVPPELADCNTEHKLHLCHKDAGSTQAFDLIGVGPGVPGSPGPGGTIEIPSNLLEKGDREFLFRCGPREDEQASCPGPTMQLVRILPGGTIEKLDERRVEIRPFRMLTSMVTTRRSSVFTDSPGNDHYKVAPSVRAEAGWKPLADDASQITVIVHGFNVPDPEFKGIGKPSWFAGWAKRMYWAGHPILYAQDKAAVVGVSWPGDIPGSPDPAAYYPEDEFLALQSGIPLGKYLSTLRTRNVKRINVFAHSLGNMAVNNALKEIPSEGSAPLIYVMNDPAISSEAFLAQYNPLAARALPGMSRLIEHAQALGYPDPENGKPNPDVIWQELEAQVERERALYGCPKKDPFPPSFSSMFCTAFRNAQVDMPPECNCDRVTTYYKPRPTLNRDAGLLDGADIEQAPTPYFTTRWGKLTRNADQSLQGAWTGFFADNLNPASAPAGVRIYHTFNSKDSVLRIDVSPVNPPEVMDKFPAWYSAQLVGKPFGPIYISQTVGSIVAEAFFGGAGATDSPEVQRWWTLAIEGRPSNWRTTSDLAADQNAVWGGSSPRGGGATDRRTRQWAELALWYPAMARAAGAVSLEPLAGLPLGDINRLGLGGSGRNIDFTSIGGDAGRIPEGSSSHSYLQIRSFADVWKGYRVIRQLFAQ